MVEAAAIPETFFTVWPNVFERGRLAAGETLLIHGGASGIGTTAIQLAKAFGARVIVTTGGKDKRAACLKLGADVGDRLPQRGFRRRRKGSDRRRGRQRHSRHGRRRLCRPQLRGRGEDGRIVQIALLHGLPDKPTSHKLMQKRLTHTGSTLRPRPVTFKAAVAASLHEKVWPLLEARKVAPVIDSTFPLLEAAKAHTRIESSAHFGKIVLTVA